MAKEKKRKGKMNLDVNNHERVVFVFNKMERVISFGITNVIYFKIRLRCG